MPEQMTETEFDALMKNCCRDGEYVTELPNYDDVYRMFLTIQAQRTALAERDAEVARLVKIVKDLAELDLDDIIADGGVTVGMHLQGDARKALKDAT